MKMVEDQTSSCVKFIERKNESNWIKIISGNGCYSFIGMQRSTEAVSLKRIGCLYIDTIAHELLHALGFE